MYWGGLCSTRYSSEGEGFFRAVVLRCSGRDVITKRYLEVLPLCLFDFSLMAMSGYILDAPILLYRILYFPLALRSLK